MRIASGVADQYVYFVGVDSTDFTTRETGLSSFTVYRSRNGAAAVAMTTPTVNEVDSTNMPGVYELLLDEDTTIASGNETEELCLHITATGMAPVKRVIELYRPKITAGNTLGVASDGDISGNVDGSVASVAGPVGSVTGSVTVGTNNDKTGYSLSTTPPTASAIADAVLDEALSGHTTAGTLGKAVADIETDATAILEDTGTDIPARFDGIEGGTFDTATDSLAAIRGQGDAAWTTATGFSTHSAADVWNVATRVLTANTNLNDLDAAGIRTAVGLASNDLDTQLAALPTASENATAVWGESISQPASVPGASANASNILGFMCALHANEFQQTASLLTIRNAADSGDLYTAAVSDDGTTAQRDGLS